MRTAPTRDRQALVALATIMASSFLVMTACSSSDGSEDKPQAPAAPPTAHIWSPEADDGSATGGGSSGSRSTKKAGSTSSRDGAGSSSGGSSGGEEPGGEEPGGEEPGGEEPGGEEPGGEEPGGEEPGGGAPNPMCGAGAFREKEKNDTPAAANDMKGARSFCGSVSAGDVDHGAFVLPKDAKSFGWGAIWSQVDDAAPAPKFTITAEGVTRGPEEEPPLFPGKRYVIRVEGTSTSDYEVLLEIVR